MDFRHDGDAHGGHFHLAGPERGLARLDYRRHPHGIDIVHTEVSPQLAGQGVGKRLIEAAVVFARGEGLQVDASCPFARKVLERDAAFADVFKPLS